MISSARSSHRLVEITDNGCLRQEDGCNHSDHLPEREVGFGDSLQAKESGQQKDCAKREGGFLFHIVCLYCFLVEGAYLTAGAVLSVMSYKWLV